MQVGGNKLDNQGDNAQVAINTGNGAITQIIHMSNYGIGTTLSPEIQAQIDAIEKGSVLKRIRLSDFVGPESPIIANKTFIGVEILGPCIVYLAKGKQVTISKCKWFGFEKSAFIEVPDEWDFMQGVIALENCEFIDCAFKNVAIMAKASAMSEIKGGFGGLA